MKKIIIISLGLLGMMMLPVCNRSPQKIVGIKIYEYDKDFGELAEKWKDMGINTAFVSTELAENRDFRQVMKMNNIKLYLIFPVFYNPELLKQDSTQYAITSSGRIAKDDWVEFVCPSRSDYRKMKVDEVAELVRMLEPDGLSIDFIRQFVFWEMIYPDRTKESIETACFCDSCVGGFSEVKGITLPDTCVTVAQKSDYILHQFSKDWDHYRCELITSMVKELADKAHDIRPGIKINVHVVPWKDGDYGGANISVAAQDIEKIAPLVDYISPMCYSQMLRRDADWIASVVSEMDKKAQGSVLPSIQVYPYYIEDPFTLEDFRKCIDRALEPPSQGVVFFSWPLFSKDSARMQIRY